MAELEKVLMTTDAVGGVWRYSIDLAAGLAEHGVKVALAVLGPPPSPTQRAEALRVPELALFQLAGALEWMDDPWTDVARVGRALQTLQSRLKASVVHLNGYCHADLDFDAPKLVVGHSCLLSWWLAVEGASAPARFDTYRGRVRRGLAGAQLVVAPSAWMLRSLEQHYGPLPRRRVIPNGSGMRAAVLPAKEPLVLCAARLWDRGKNVATLANAARGLSWPVYVAGAGNGGLPDVRTLGTLGEPELSSWYGRAGIYALPARYEPFGLSVLEAALHGCALVLGDIPSLRELWGGAAQFVAPDDTARLRLELEALIGDSERRRALGQQARLRARAFRPSAMAREYLGAYHQLLANRPRALSGSAGAA